MNDLNQADKRCTEIPAAHNQNNPHKLGRPPTQATRGPVLVKTGLQLRNRFSRAKSYLKFKILAQFQKTNCKNRKGYSLPTFSIFGCRHYFLWIDFRYIGFLTLDNISITTTCSKTAFSRVVFVIFCYIIHSSKWNVYHFAKCIKIRFLIHSLTKLTSI